MFNRHRILSKKTSLVAAFLGLLTVMALARPAHAASTIGHLTQVEFNANNANWPQLVLQIDSNLGTNFYAQQPKPSTTCSSIPDISADSIKAFVSIAQGAFLAGKKVTITFFSCVGFNYITDILMQ